MLNVVCAHCGARGKAPEKLAGRTIACPKCKEPLSIPAPPPPTFAEEDDELYGLAGEPAPANVGPSTNASGFVRDAGGKPPASAPGAPAGVFAETMRPKRKKRKSAPRRRESRIWFFALTFVPLLLSLLPHDDMLVRAAKTMRDLGERQVVQVEDSSDDEEFEQGLFRRVAQMTPEKKIEGAHLGADSKIHWLYALLSAGLFFGLIAFLFPLGAAKPGQLLIIGGVTGTLGVLLLLGLQTLMVFALPIRVFGFGVVSFFLLLLHLIALSYRLAFDSSVGFLPQFFGFTFGVGLCEELVKAAPILVYAMNSRGRLDWRAFRAWGLASGAGFGVAEGVMYSANIYNGVSPALDYLTRFVSLVALHAVLSGGAAVMLYNNAGQFDFEDRFNFLLNVFLVFGIAMVSHGLYNTFVSREMSFGGLIVALASLGWLRWLSERTRQSEG